MLLLLSFRARVYKKGKCQQPVEMVSGHWQSSVVRTCTYLGEKLVPDGIQTHDFPASIVHSKQLCFCFHLFGFPSHFLLSISSLGCCWVTAVVCGVTVKRVRIKPEFYTCSFPAYWDLSAGKLNLSDILEAWVTCQSQQEVNFILACTIKPIISFNEVIL